jgi:hypothetical protein
MIIHSTDIHPDFDKAKLAFVHVARDLGVEYDCRLRTMWRIDIDGNELTTFLELAHDLLHQ